MRYNDWEEEKIQDTSSKRASACHRRTNRFCAAADAGEGGGMGAWHEDGEIYPFTVKQLFIDCPRSQCQQIYNFYSCFSGLGWGFSSRYAVQGCEEGMTILTALAAINATLS